jgi:hypothetical protein
LQNRRVVNAGSLSTGGKHRTNPIEEALGGRDTTVQIRELEMRVSVHESRKYRDASERHIFGASGGLDRNDPPFVDCDDSPVDRRIRYRKNPVG